MNEFEVFVEDINSCGGEQYAKKSFLEIEAEDFAPDPKGRF